MKNERYQGIFQFIKFGLVGVSNTAVDWVIFFLLTITFLKEAETFAKALAFLVAMLNSYLWNTIWTFKKEYRDATAIEGTNVKRAIFMKFAVVSILGWGLNTLAFNFTRFDLDQSKVIALIVASAVATLLNYFANKLWTYKK
ncbi:MAG: GtrA family protein [Patescibacteria group bacterium]